MTILNFFSVGNPVFLISRPQVRPPARSKLVLVQDERFDTDWDRLVDWAGAPASPLEIMNAFDLQGLWTGTFEWADQPQPEFVSAAFFAEHFNTGWIGTNVAPVHTLAVSGIVALDQVLTADVSGLVDEDGLPASNTYTYQWQWETSPDVFEDISGETSATYTVTRFAMGKRVRFQLQYQDLLLNDETLYSAATAVVGIVDIPVEGAPTIQNLTSAGQPAQQGHVLSAVTTAIFDFNTIASAFSYQWLRETAVGSNTYVEIDGATSQTYAVQAADIAPSAADTRYVKVRVSFTDGLGKVESVDSVSGYATIDSAFSGTPTIDSSTVVFDVGTQLTANVSALQDANDPLVHEYQWYAEVFGSPGTFLPVSGATSPLFNITSEYQKRKIKLRTTTTDSLGNQHVAWSAETTRVNSLPEGQPSITGVFRVNQTLTSSLSDVSDYDQYATGVSRRWQVETAEGSNEYTNTNEISFQYVVRVQDINKRIRVRANWTDTLGKNEEVFSDPVLIVDTLPTGKPVLSGTFEVGQTITANPAPIQDANTITSAFSYQWQRSLSVGSGYEDISGQNGSTYIIAHDDIGYYLRAAVTFTDLGGVTSTIVSDPTVVVNSTYTGNVSLGGTAEIGQTISIDTSSVGDANGVGEFSYEWFRSTKYLGENTADTAISGATGSSYVVQPEDAGKEIYAKATFTDLAPRNAETYTLSTQGYVPPASSLLVHLDPANKASYNAGSTIYDLSGNNRNAIRSGDLAFDNGTKRIAFDASGDYATLPYAALTDLGQNFTISFLARDYDATMTYFSTLDVTTNNTRTKGFSVYKTNGVLGVRSGRGTWTWIGGDSSGPNIGTGNYYLINVSKDSSGNVYFYVNGVKTLGETNIGNVYQTDIHPDSVRLAGVNTATRPSYNSSSNRMDLGYFSIHRRVLTDREIAEMHAALSQRFVGTFPTYRYIPAPPVGLPVITGRATTAAILTADTSGISDSNGLGTFSYQWKVDGVNVGSNSTTYTVQTADYGKNVTVTVSYTDKAGYPETLTSEPLTIINYAPTGQLTISGTPQVSYTLTAGGLVDADGITPANVTYQWLSAGVEVQNSTDPTYVVQPTDYAKQIVVRASYTDDSGNVETPDLYSVLTAAAVTIVNSPPTGEVYVLDQHGNQPAGVEEGVVLVADPSAVRDINEYDDQTPDSFTYQWKRNGVAISGQTAQTYTTRFSEYGGAISVTVTYTDDNGNVESVTSTNSVNIINSPPVGDVLITGEPRVGMTLTADPSGITDVNYIAEPSYILDYPDEYTVSGPAFSIDNTVVSGRSAIRWEGSGGARTVTFNQPTLFIGLTIYREWQQSSSLWSAEYLTINDVWVSYASGQNNDGWTPVTPSMTNGHVLAKAVRFSTYSYNQSGFSKAYVTIKTGPRPETQVFAYQWFRDDGTGPAAISGATSKNYVLTEADYGQNLTVRAAYNDLHGTAESVTSSIPVLVDARGYPVIDGAVEVGQTVTANTSSMDDVEGVGTLHYAWEAKLLGETEFSAVGTDAATFVVPEGYKAATLRVTVSYDDLQGNPESAMSEIVYVRSDPTGAIALSGRDPAAYYVGDVVTADVSAIEDLNGFPAPSAITYEWRRNDVAITSLDSSAIYEQPIDIVNAGASSLSDYHVEVVLNTAALVSANKMLADSRVEFRDSLGNVIPYWFEGPENHQKSVYWLKMNLPVGTTTITARYSQDASFAACEGRAEDMGFLFFEDFDNGLDNWVKVGADGVFSTSSGNLVGTNTSAYLQSVAQFSDPVIARSVAIFPDSPPNGATSIGFWNSTADQVYILEHNSTTYYKNNGSGHVQLSFDGEGTGVIKDEIILTGSQAQVTRSSGGQSVSSGFFSHTQGTKPLFLGRRGDLTTIYGDQSYNGTWYYIHVRPYVAGANVSVALGTETLSYGSVYRLVAADSGQSINVVMSYTDLHGYSETVTSSAVAVSNSPATGSVSIDGSPYTGSTFTANTSGLADLDGIDSASYGYQWFVSGVEAAGETAVTYTVTAADVNQTITVRVDFADNTGATYSVTSAGRLILNTPATGEALLTGTALVGETLTLDMSPVSDVDGSIQNISYQWYEAPARNLLASVETLIADATTDTFVIPAGAENKEYRAVVSYEDGNGGSYTQRVPKLAAVPEQDLALLLDAAALSSYEYGTTSWNDLSGNGNNAVVPSNKWSTATQGRFVFNGTAASFSSADLLNLGANFTISGLVYVSGSGTQAVLFSNYEAPEQYGSTVYPVKGISVRIVNNKITMYGSAGWYPVNYSSVATLASNTYYFISVKITGADTSYPNVQVYVNGQEGAKAWAGELYRSAYVDYNGPGAVAWSTNQSVVYVGRSYDVAPMSDIGFVSVHKRALSDSEIASMYEAFRDRLDAASPQRKIVQGDVVGLPVITGTPQAGSTLTANLSGMSDPNGPASAYTYQWKADGVNISGATSSTFALTANQFNKQVTVDVTFLDRLGASNTVTSAPVQIENTPATGTVTISGTPEVNQPLTAVTSDLQDVNGKPVVGEMTYRWYVDDVLALESVPVAAPPWGGVTNGLVLRLDGTGGTGTSWADLSGQSNNGTLLNGASFTENTVRLNGVDDYVRVTTNPASFMRNEFTHMAWVYFTGDNNTHNAIFWSEGAQGGGSGYQLLFAINNPDSTSSTFEVRLNNSVSGWSPSTTPSTGVNFKDSWHHVAWSFNNGTTKIYLDGQLFWTNTSRGSYTGGTTSPFHIGARNDSSYASYMRVSVVQAYDRELSLAEIQQNYAIDPSRLLAGGSATATDLGSTANTTYTIQPDDIFKDVHVSVSFTDDQGNAEGPFVSAPVTIVNSLPTGTFEIQGTVAEGEVLSVDITGIGDPNGMPSDGFEYQWYRDSVAVANATSSDYLITATDYASTRNFTAEVSFVDLKGTRELVEATKTSSADLSYPNLVQGLSYKQYSSASYSPVSLNLSAPNALGTSAYTSAVNPSIPSNSSIQLVGYVVAKQTKSYSFSLSADDAGYLWIGDSATATIPTVDSALIQNRSPLTYSQIFASISLTAGQFYPIRIYHAAGGSPNGIYVTIPSGVTLYTTEGIWETFGDYAPAPQGTVSISGTPQQGQILTALKSGDWASASTGFTYQWYRDDVAIWGERSVSYTVQAQDYGRAIKVQAAYTDPATGFSSAASSTPVTIVNSPPVGTLTISGSVYNGQTIYANPSFSDANTLGTLSYQWYADDVAIPDATASTYVVVEALGTAISVTASYVDGAGNAESVTSLPVLVGSAPPVGSVTIAGTYRVGEELTATVDVSDADGIQEGTTVYQWTRGGADIAGATALSYTLVDADIGQAVAMEVRYTDNLGEQESLSSAAAVVLGYPVVVANPLADQDTYAGLAVSFVVPADAFSDPDGGALTYAASGMPAWLAFDAATRTFSGTPSADDVGVSTITVTATDSDADSASDAFDMTVHARVTESFEFDGDDRWPDTLPEAEPTPGFNYSSASTSFDPSSGWPAPPVISGSASLTVEENIDAATVLETYTADVSVAWSLAGTDAAAFSIDASSGELRFVQSPDFETKSSYSLLVVATRTSGQVSNQSVSVTVTDLSEDPYFNNVSLLLKMDSDFSDASQYARTVTANGAAVISSVESKFGGASAYFDGTGDYLTTPLTAELQLGTGDFTIEFWHNLSSRKSSYPALFSNYNSFGAGSLALFAGHQSSNTSRYQLAVNGTFPAIEPPTVSVAYGVWTHIAVVRSDNIITLFINGIGRGISTGQSSALNGVGSTFYIGSTGDSLASSSIHGYIDDFRVTKGVARYTANFTPPGSFPTS